MFCHIPHETYFAPARVDPFLIPRLAHVLKESHQQLTSREEEKEDADNVEQIQRIDRGVYLVSSKDSIKIHFDVPGVKPTDISLKHELDVLVLEAHRRSFGERKKSYIRHLPLDANIFDVANACAYAVDGVLTLTVPKKEQQAVANVTIAAEEYSGDDTVLATIDVPGVKPTGLEITFNGRSTIQVSAERNGRTIFHRRSLPVGRNIIESLKGFVSNGELVIVGRLEKPATHVIAVSELADVPNTDEKEPPQTATPATTENEEEEEDVVVVDTVTEEDEQ